MLAFKMASAEEELANGTSQASLAYIPYFEKIQVGL
jgi:hypothetical protein